MEKLVPKLRFPAFADEWREKLLGNIGEFKNGINKSADDFGFGHPFINLMDVFGKDFLLSENFGLVNASANELDKYNLLKGDVLFIRSSVKREGVGQTIVVLEDIPNTVYSGFLIRFRFISENFTDHFKRYCFYTQKFRSALVSKSTTSANTNINQDSLSTLTVRYPSLPEQIKISEFLTGIDKRIELLAAKKQKLILYKKGVMQKIFNQELKFKDENGEEFPEWRPANAGDLFASVTNKNHNSDLPILAITQEYGAIPRNLIDYNISVSDKSIDSYKVVEKGDFIISLRSFQGGIEYSNYLGICSPAYIILKPKVAIVDNWFKIFFKTDSYIVQLNERLEGIRDGKMISYKNFSETKIKLPSLKEQAKISEFILSVDVQIQKVEQQLLLLQSYKKGLLQDMFV